jgi:hypothetical protein
LERKYPHVTKKGERGAIEAKHATISGNCPKDTLMVL